VRLGGDVTCLEHVGVEVGHDELPGRMERQHVADARVVILHKGTHELAQNLGAAVRWAAGDVGGRCGREMWAGDVGGRCGREMWAGDVGGGQTSSTSTAITGRDICDWMCCGDCVRQRSQRF
jgi:hypothetical protein